MTKEKNIYPDKIDTRVALLEQSIGSINQTFIDIKNELKEIRTEIKDIKKEMGKDFRWLITVICGLAAIMAHGFHWF